MISVTQIDHHWTWFRRILQQGYSSGICRRFGSFIELIILIFGIAVVAFHFSRVTLSLSMTVIVSGITFFIIRELMTVYDRHQESKQILTAQLGEFPECFLNLHPAEALDMKEAVTTSVSTES